MRRLILNCTWDTHDVRGTPKMYVGHLKRSETFEIILRHCKEYIHLKNVRGTPKMYVGHLKRSETFEIILRHCKDYINHKNVRGTPKMYVGHPKRMWNLNFFKVLLNISMH